METPKRPAQCELRSAAFIGVRSREPLPPIEGRTLPVDCRAGNLAGWVRGVLIKGENGTVRKRLVIAALMLALPMSAKAQDGTAAEAAPETSPAVEQLRHVIGEWDVVTTFIRPDGSVAGRFDGSYVFEWVMEDKIVKGLSTIPQFQMSSGLLFYLRDSTGEIEMTSVGPDGQLWVMTGPQDSETRETPVVDMPDGTTLKLRFTRFNVSEDRFESKMERSTDGGATWVQGNHQVFVRRVAEASS